MAQAQAPLWELRGIRKGFAGVQALDDVSMTLLPGEIHALVGENGSGKSTLVKCLAGVHQPDTGELLLNGKPVTVRNPFEARTYGVATIFQEFSLVPTLSVTENIFLGRPLRNKGLIDWAAMRQETLALFKLLDIVIDPDAIVRSLSVAEQQLTEIAKAISLESTLLIMDEPTAALGLSETRQLQSLVRRLAEQGKAILYISHRLDEVFEVADRVTVLKDGRLVSTRQATGLQMREVVHMMVGVDIEQHYPKVVNAQTTPCLEVQDITTENGVNGVTFTVNVGEVLGLGGMVGAGRTEIARAIFGLDSLTGGTIRLNGRRVRFTRPAKAIAAGVGLLPENRKLDGLFFNFEGPPNITISRLSELAVGPFISLQRESRFGTQFIGRLSITPAAMEKSVRFLSGGNQQKVVIARWLFSQARLLILDEPTQGIDIGAKLDVYGVINELTSQGISILLISSDYPELLAMSDRVAVVRGGKVVHIAEASRLSQFELLALASGAGVSELVQQSRQLRDVALPRLRALRDRTRQTVHLAVIDEQEMSVLYLDKLTGEQQAGMKSSAGATAPLTATGVGKALLAYRPREEIAEWIQKHELPRFTDNTITGIEDFMTELDTIRATGMSLDREEHEVGVRCIAAPVFDAAGNVVAAISVSGSTTTMPPDLAQSEMCRDVVATARAISEALVESTEEALSTTARAAKPVGVANG